MVTWWPLNHYQTIPTPKLLKDLLSCISGITTLVAQAIESKSVKQIDGFCYLNPLYETCLQKACPSFASRASVESNS